MIFVLTMFFSFSTFASDESYQKALRFYQEQNFTEAQTQLSEVLTKEPQNKFALYNWGLASYKLSQRGRAVAAWRRALTLDPNFSLPAKALRFAQTEMPNDVFDHGTSTWESLRANVLDEALLDRFYGLSVLLLLGTLFLGVRYFGARHRAYRDETALPPFPTVATVFALLLVISIGLTASKFVAVTETRATIIDSGVVVRSGPNEADNSLFELIEGTEVIVRMKVKDWLQVTYPGGLTGWIPTRSAFVTSGDRI